MSSEKTEKATPKKLRDARKKGQAPRSKELATTALLIFSFTSMMLFGGDIFTTLKQEIVRSLTVDQVMNMKGAEIFNYAFDVGLKIFLACIGMFVSAMAIAVVGNIALGGFVISAEKLVPKFSNINPISGIKKMFSMKQLVELVKSILKAVIIAIPAYYILHDKFYHYLSTRMLFNFDTFVDQVADDIMVYGLLFSSLLIFLVMIDVPFQIYSHSKQLKMSKQEIKDEYKNTEGSPEVKGRRRRVQMEMAAKAKNSRVLDADVVITNPTHFSVGVKFDPASMDVPKVVALGADMYAFKIREEAKELKIPVVSVPPLARVLYKTCVVGSEVPSELYAPMALVLGEIYKLDDRLSAKFSDDFVNNLKINEEDFR